MQFSGMRNADGNADWMSPPPKLVDLLLVVSEGIDAKKLLMKGVI